MNVKLNKARNVKNDEFRTRLVDIENEIGAYLEFNPDIFRDKTILLPCDDPDLSNFTRYFSQNFNAFGLKKIISASFAPSGRGKFAIRTAGGEKAGKLECDGDFRSYEIIKFRDEADIVITNPPFSLCRDFIAWISDCGKQFSIIVNKNLLTCKNVFPLIMRKVMWSGFTKWSGGMWFETNTGLKNVPSIWLANIPHGKRCGRMSLKTMSENLAFCGKYADMYAEYDNYHAVEVPSIRVAPSDYDGIMGVPVSFLEKFNPEQFEIIGIDSDVKDGKLDFLIRQSWLGKLDRGYINGRRCYSRIFVKLI